MKPLPQSTTPLTVDGPTIIAEYNTKLLRSKIIALTFMDHVVAGEWPKGLSDRHVVGRAAAAAVLRTPLISLPIPPASPPQSQPPSPPQPHRSHPWNPDRK